MLLKDKYIMISGIGPGLGVKLAIHAATEGAAGVGISCRSQEKLDDAIARIREASPACKIVPHITNIKDPRQCESFAQACINAFGRIDALVNNAVYHGPSLQDDASTADFADWPEQYAVNVMGTVKMTQAVLPQMKQQGGGAIVMVSTMGVKMPPIIGEAGYCASKAALFNVTRKLVQEVGPDNIRVNTVHPGWMWGVPVQQAVPYLAQDWGMTEEQAVEHIKSQQALRRITTDDEVARATLFLASDYSSAMTGATLDANGGNFLE